MSKPKSKKIIIWFAVLFLPILFVLHIVINVDPIIEQVSDKEVKALATVAINKACDSVLAEYNALDIVDYVMDNNGNLQMVTTNTALINTISRKAIDASQEKIERLGEEGVPIPLGSLSGITILAGQGPDVYIKVFPIGAVNATLSSQFEAAGINQTKHKIMLNVTADIKVVMPGANNVVKTQAEILLCENIILGKVPEFYFQTDNLSDLLNLMP